MRVTLHLEVDDDPANEGSTIPLVLPAMLEVCGEPVPPIVRRRLERWLLDRSSFDTGPTPFVIDPRKLADPMTATQGDRIIALLENIDRALRPNRDLDVKRFMDLLERTMLRL